ncbi:CDC50/LEM3 family [Entophlyctis helioformis]|nr:CDC50/LEM3 family [Entophlyctis helioformis]
MSKNPESKKPQNTAFKQQRLKAWQPLLTPKTVLPTFFLIGIVFVPLGIGLYLASDRVVQVAFDYTKCSTTATNVFGPAEAGSPISQWKYDPASQICSIQFNIANDIPAPVFMYYRLTNFFQNNRRYVKSFDSKQLLEYRPANALDNNCEPLRVPANGTEWVIANGVNVTIGNKAANDPDPQYYPCGLIANSLFSDEISDLSCITSPFQFSGGQVCSPSSSTSVIYKFSPNGIAWPSDADKFAAIDPTKLPFDASKIPTTLIPPPYWRKAWPEKYANGYNSTNLPDLKTLERLHVWMRTAGLPTFRKLWGRNVESVLPRGTWQVDIKQNFDVGRYSGTKSIVLSSVSVLGGKNPFLGIAYICVGTICWALGIAFLARHMLKPRKLGDHTYLSWNQPQNQRAPGNSAAPDNSLLG